MAGPIRIALVADATGVAKGMESAAASIDSGVATAERAAGRFERSAGGAGERAADSLEKFNGKVDKVSEGFDTVDTAAMGFRDAITGIQDGMSGLAILTGQGQKKYDAYKAQVEKAAEAHKALEKSGKASKEELAASQKNLDQMNAKLSQLSQGTGSTADGLLMLGFGIGDSASAIVNFLLPAFALAGPAVTGMKTAMTGLNLTFLTNPVFLVIAAIVALVAVFVIAYQRSETFRRIVNGAFSGVLNAVRGAWNWIRGNWPLLLAILTGPIGIAVRFITQHWTTIVTTVKAIPGKIREAFNGAGNWLKTAGKNIVQGIWNGINGMSTWLYNTLIGWAKRIIPGPIAKALGIASPSRVVRALTRWVPRGAALGITDGTREVVRAAGRMASAMVPPLSAPTAAAAPAGAAGTLRLELPAGSSGAGALIVELLRGELRRGGGLKAVLGS